MLLLVRDKIVVGPTSSEVDVYYFYCYYVYLRNTDRLVIELMEHEMP